MLMRNIGKLPRLFLLALVFLLAASSSSSMFIAPSHAFAEELLSQEVTISNFESDDEGWAFINGDEFPGSTGNFVVDALDSYSGSGSGKLTGDFTGGGVYVSTNNPIVPTDMERLSLQVKTSDATSFVLRLLDDSGQTHQQTVDLEPVDDWQSVDILSLNAGKNAAHWGGADDGEWHGPGVGIQLMLTADGLNGDKTTGVIRFDELIAYAPAPPIVIKQNKPGNLFSNGSASFTVQKLQGDTLSWRVIDFWGRQVAAGTKAAPRTEKRIHIPRLDSGYYSFRVEALSGDVSYGAAENTFAILPKIDMNRISESPFGVATHFGQSWDLEMMPLVEQLGVKSIRDEMFWHAIEQEKGVYSFPALYDEIDQTARLHGIDPFIVLTYTNEHYDQDSTPYTDEGRAGFANYGNAVMNQYPGMQWVEVYNEFNIGFGDRGDGPADSLPAYYFELLKKTYTTIKATRPEVTVVGASTANMPWDWLEELFSLGGLQYMDAISVHPYRYPAPPESMEEDIIRLNNLMKEYNNGVALPIWGTEIGWPTQLDSRGVSEKVQADYAVRSYVQALALGVDKLFWYDFMNDGLDSSYNEHNFGLVRNFADPWGKYAPKPAYAAYGIMTRQLLGHSFSRQETVSDGIYDYVFGSGRNETRVIWSTEPKTLALQADRQLQLTDMMGSLSTLRPGRDGYVYLTVSESPVYVTGPVTGIEESGKLALSAEGGVKGEPVTVTLTVNDSSTVTEPLTGTFKIEGEAVPITISGGELQQFEIELPAMNNDQTIFGDIVVNGRPIAKLSTEVHLTEPVAYNIRHVVTDQYDALRVSVSNLQSEPFLLGGYEWQVGTLSGSDQTGMTVAAHSTGTFDIPVTGLEAGQTYPVSVTLTGDGVEPYTHTGKWIGIDAASIGTMTQKTMMIDGSIDDDAGTPHVNLASGGTVQMNPYGGSDDLNGDIWLHWDQQYFYLAANIQDDVFTQDSVNDAIWQGDGLQFAISQGAPGESALWSELGVALTPQGPQMYRWADAMGETPGPLPHVQVEVVRNETDQTTIYELAIPWTAIAPFTPEDGGLSVSLLVNDNDGQGRKGFIEWGSGIGMEKNNALFNYLRFIP